MRAFLAALIFCLCAIVATSADAHARHRHHHHRHHHHHASVAAQMLGPGLIHMLQSAERNQHAQAWPTAETMGRLEPAPMSASVNVAAKVGAVIAHTVRAIGDPRPRAWCGWYLRQVFGVADRAFNLAANWVHYGRPAFGPAPGVIVVWRHHVGQIVGYASNGEWLVNSGNDGHAVRTRPRSLAGAIALRW